MTQSNETRSEVINNVAKLFTGIAATLAVKIISYGMDKHKKHSDLREQIMAKRDAQ